MTERVKNSDIQDAFGHIKNKKNVNVLRQFLSWVMSPIRDNADCRFIRALLTVKFGEMEEEGEGFSPALTKRLLLIFIKI